METFKAVNVSGNRGPCGLFQQEVDFQALGHERMFAKLSRLLVGLHCFRGRVVNICSQLPGNLAAKQSVAMQKKALGRNWDVVSLEEREKE